MPVSPTYSNLLKLKKELQVAKEGYNLLDEKREVMVMELMDNIHGYRDMEEEITEKLEDAYRALEDAFVTVGEEEIKRFKGTVKPEIDVRMRSIMGIPVPELMVDLPQGGLQSSMESTDENFDSAVIRFRETLEILVKWAAREVLLWRLGAEINKTQKRVNALDNVFIPRYRENIKRIEEYLEEEDREEFFRRKLFKSGE